MKKLVILSILFAFISVTKTNADYYGNEVNFNYFYSTLAPYGEWIEIDQGVLAWRPTFVNYDWQPYTIGRWSWTRDGWYWESYESFGWATYHYGRWYYDDYYGWIWLPGYDWAPAWVEWRYNDNYIGWAPLSPYAVFNINFGIRFRLGWRTNYRYWHFVRYGNFCNRNVNYYFVNNNYKYRIFNKTKYRTNYYADNGRIINGGIDRRFISRRGKITIRERNIRRVSTLRDYNNSRMRNGSNIRTFRPDEKQLRSVRKTKNYTIRKSHGKSSLRVDKIRSRRTERSFGKQLSSERNIGKRNNTIENKREFSRNSTRSVKTRKRVDSPIVYRNRSRIKNNSNSYDRSNPSLRTAKKQKPNVNRNHYRVKNRTNISVNTNKIVKSQKRLTRKNNSNLSKRSIKKSREHLQTKRRKRR